MRKVSNLWITLPLADVISIIPTNEKNSSLNLAQAVSIFAYEFFSQECIKIGIKPYAFHLNYEPGIDEEYVLKYEINYFYGIYADDWTF